MTDTNPNKAAPNSGWIDWATRTTAILAVIAALSSGRWGASNLQAILEQGKVNDTWAYYQAKSIKQSQLESTRNLMRAMSSQNGDHPQVLNAMIRDATAQAIKESAEKDEQMRAAQEFTMRRNKMVERGFWFEISFAALQLGVVLCTVASAAKNKMLWYASIAFGLIGLVVLVNGFHSFYHAPHSWYGGTAEDMSYNGTTPQANP